jgi:hypothetical protein
MRSAKNPAFAVLVEEGFTRDSSLTTAPQVGDRSNPGGPAILETASGPIMEVPPLMGTFFGFRAMWGGGVCARLTRESRVVAAIDRAIANGIPPVLYAHPWEFDDAHPPMPGLSPVQRLVHFAGRRRTEGRWRRLLARHRCKPIASIRAGEGEISAKGKTEEKKDLARDRVSRMADVKGPRPLCGARSARSLGACLRTPPDPRVQSEAGLHPRPRISEKS